MLAQHEGRFVVPAFDFRACTHAQVHTRLPCCDGVKHAQHLYSHTPILTPRFRGQECNCPAPPRLLSFTSGHRPPWPLSTVLVRIARNSPVPQKWYKCIIYLHLTRRCTVCRSWLHTPVLAVLSTTQLSSAQLRAPCRCPLAVLGSSELRSSELMSAVRAPRGCQGSSSVSAGACLLACLF